MAKVSKSQAAKMASVSRPTIDKKIRSGQLSVKKKDDGTTEIDVAELERVFGKLVVPDDVKPLRKDLHTDTSQVATILQSQIDRLQRELDVNRQGWEREREKYQEQIDKLLEVVKNQTLMLAAPKEPEPKKTFWQRLFSS